MEKRYICNVCGDNIKGVEVTEHYLEVAENGVIANVFDQDTLYSYYKCENHHCQNKSDVFSGSSDLEKLKEIAILKEV